MVLRGRIVVHPSLPGVTGLPATAFLSPAPVVGAYAVAQCHNFPDASETRREIRGLWRCLVPRSERKSGCAQGGQAASTFVGRRHDVVEKRGPVLTSMRHVARLAALPRTI